VPGQVRELHLPFGLNLVNGVDTPAWERADTVLLDSGWSGRGLDYTQDPGSPESHSFAEVAMTPEWITLTIFEDNGSYSLASGGEIDIRPSHILSMTEIKHDAELDSRSQFSGRSPETIIILNEPIDTLEDANEYVVVRGLRKVVAYETLREIRVMLGR
jgi:hypothetical protein